MNIVGIDTSGPSASCAVLRDGVVAELVFMNRGLTHSETLMPALDAALRGAQLRCEDVDCFAAVAGPGSFTGVRLGVCAAKGLAHAWGRPVARIDALEALSMNLAGFDGLVCPILDARRGQVYCAAFDVRGGLPERVMDDGAMELGAFLSQLPRDRRLAFMGDGLRVHESLIREQLPEAWIAPPNLRDIRADAACLLSQARPERWMEAAALTPIYLRAPQAERERARRLRKASQAAG